MFNRRDFLKTSGLVAWGMSAPTFLAKTAAAAPLAGTPGAKDNILVVVEMTGGNDGLNTVVPLRDDLYAKYRPTLRITPDKVKKVNDQIGLHPSLGGFASLLEDKALCLVQGVGYPNPNESHFVSMDIWHSAGFAEDPKDGWLGKALGRMAGTNAFHVGADNESTPVALAGAPFKVPSITRLEDFQPRTSASSNSDRQAQRKIIEGVGGAKTAGLLDFVQRTAVNTYATSKRLQEIAKGYEPKVTYPVTGLANRLKLAAQLIDAGLGARIFYVSIDGFDTHANQAASHGNLLQEVSDAMTAFFKDMAARGQRDRVLMMTFSEFGRRPKENGSKGTDHGAAAPLFLVGGKVQPGAVGEQPNLTAVNPDGNLKHSIDFRQVYASVLNDWLGVPSKEILGGDFKPVKILRT